MDSEKTSDAPQSHALALPTELRELMGLIALVFMIIALIYAIFGVSLFGAHLAPRPQGHCWQLQAIDGKTYKVNTCNGKTVLLNGTADKTH